MKKDIPKPASLLATEYFCDFCGEKISDTRWNDGLGDIRWDGGAFDFDDQSDPVESQHIIAEVKWDGALMLRVRPRAGMSSLGYKTYVACFPCHAKVKATIEDMLLPEARPNDKTQRGRDAEATIATETQSRPSLK
jgi:hypothetical protein